MKIGMDSRDGLVAISGDEVVCVQDALGIPATHADPLRWLLAQPDAFSRLVTAVRRGGLPTGEFDYSALRAPISRPGKVIAAPVNYRDHQVEMNAQATIAEYGIFLKANSSITGPNGVVHLPYQDKRTDQEGELGVVIGVGGRNIPREQALAHVFGYCCLLDISLRSTEDRSTRKSFDTFTPIGPWVTTQDEVPDPADLALECSVNGTVRQRVSTNDLIFDVPQLIAYASSIMTLEPGDVIATGTPAGVGPLSDGDEVHLTIEGLGTLRVTVDASTARPYGSRPNYTHYATEPATSEA